VKTFLWTLAVLLFCAGASFAQTPGVAVTAKLIDGQGNTIKTAYLHFELWNCGLNVPQVIGAPLTVVTSHFDLHANPTTGLISGSTVAIDGQIRVVFDSATPTVFLLISASLSFAQTPGVAVTATLINGQGQTIKTAYLHFELWNCGVNVPQVISAVESSRQRG
jgi:hypothetical protein